PGGDADALGVGAVADPADDSSAAGGAGAATGAARTHTVARGESAWSIGKRYGIAPKALLQANGLGPRAVIKPGMVLRLDTP
ncbi:MAG: LysM domain-containing protein, partial [Pseudoxanthomonas sp.]